MVRRLLLSMAALAALVPTRAAAQTGGETPPGGPGAAADPAPASAAAPAAPRPPPVSLPAAPPVVTPGPSREAGRVPYVYATAGKVIPWGHDMKDFSGGLAVEGGVGVEIEPHVAVEAGVGHFTVAHRLWAPVAGYDVVDEIGATPLVATLRVLGRSANAEYFATAGLGVYWMSFERKVNSVYGGPPFSDADTTRGAHLGAGIVSYLSPRVTLGATARYTWVNATFSGTTIHVDGMLVSGAIGYRF